MGKRTFTIENIGVEALTASDLVRIVQSRKTGKWWEPIRNLADSESKRTMFHTTWSTLPTAYRIWIDGSTESTQAIAIDRRIGIAWGGDATWAEVPFGPLPEHVRRLRARGIATAPTKVSLEIVTRAVDTWLNDPDEWNSWN